MFKVSYFIAFVQLWFVFIDSHTGVGVHSTTEINVQVTKNNWWGASQTGCEEFGGQLFVPRSQDITQDVAAILDPGSYWIGAMSYSSWKWTYDKTSLYVYIGYIQSNNITTAGVEIDGITVFLCHLHCGEDYTQFGLQGSYCYCLRGDYSSQMLPSSLEQKRCAGSYEEWCGNEQGMSIYETGDIDLRLNSIGQCVYVMKRQHYHSGNTTFHQDGDCTTKRSMAFTKTRGDKARSHGRCIGTTCVDHGRKTWDESERTHVLLKVTDYNMADLNKAMTTNDFASNYYTYWIGLRRVHRQTWINGSDVLMSRDPSSGQSCLYLNKSDQNITFLWRQCSAKLKSICQTVPPTTPGFPTTLSEFPSGVDNRTVPLPSAGHVYSYGGTAVGGVVSFLTVTALVLVTVFILKRKRLLCFHPIKSKTRTEMGIFDNAMENKTYSNLPEPDDHIYSNPFPQAENAEVSGTYQHPDILSASARISAVLKSPCMNEPVPTKDGEYNARSGNQPVKGHVPTKDGEYNIPSRNNDYDADNQPVTVPASLHAYDRNSRVEKMVSRESRPEGDPQTVKTLVDDYETNGVQKIHSDENECQSLDDIDPTFLEANTYELAQSFDDAQPCVEDSSGRHEEESSVVTTDRCNIHNPAGDVGESIGNTSCTGVVRDHEPCYYNTAYSSDDLNKNNEDDKPDRSQETKNRIHASEA